MRTLVTLGDSTPVGLGDPLPGGGWRGFPALLGAALGATVVNPSRTGARMACVRREQLPAALGALRAGEPSAAVLFAGMNDTLRSDFQPGALRDDCSAVAAELRRTGAHVLVVRYHDHTRVFRLPAPLRRALARRIAALNAAIDAVAATDPAGIGVLDLHTLPGGYDRTSWSVDRLHPSERGHRLLAAGLAQRLLDAGYAVPRPVSLDCAGGRDVTSAQRIGWLVVKGLPWLVRRGRDLGPVIVQGMIDGRRSQDRDLSNRPIRSSDSSNSGNAVA
ncbi:MAG: GDSL-type esterase/lipase family protein [Pseudonocardia sp.]